MSLQFPASPLSSGNDTRTDKAKADSIPMHEHADKAIEDFLHGETRSDQSAAMTPMEVITSQAASNPAASEVSKKFLTMENIINDFLSKPVSEDNPETVGGALSNIAENIQELLKDIQNGSCGPSNGHPTVSLGGGFVIDIICGEIKFDMSRLIEYMNSQESTNGFKEMLEDNNNNSSIPDIKDIINEAAKGSTEFKAQKEIKTENQGPDSVLKDIMKSSMLSKTYKDSESSNDPMELSEDSNSSVKNFRNILEEAGKGPTEITLQQNIESEKKQAETALKELIKDSSVLSGAYMEMDSDKVLGLLS